MTTTFPRQEILHILAGASVPVPEHIRPAAERAIGAGVSRVAIHTGIGAAMLCRALDADAVTVGRHVLIPTLDAQSRSGCELLLHEIVHAAQQHFAEPDAAGDAFLVDPWAELEAEATAIAAGCRLISRHAPSPAATALQRHAADPCLHVPPIWVELTDLRQKSLWLPANQVIEAEYIATHPGNTILLGSQFEGQRDIRLPRGASDAAANNEILNQLRGISNQRAPDIVDFTERVFYEIKTARYVQEGRNQLTSLYQLTDTITTQFGGQPWNPDLATWYPRHHYPMPAALDKMICTADTDHNQSPAGLLLYRVYQRLQAKESKESQKHAVAIVGLDGQLEKNRDQFLKALSPLAQSYDPGTDLWIVAGEEAYRWLVLEPQMERTTDLMRVHGLDARRNPAMGFRNLIISTPYMVGLAATATMIVVGMVAAAILAVIEAAPVAVGATAVGTATATVAPVVVEEAAVVSLAAYRAMRAAATASKIAKVAASIIFVVGVLESREAKAASLNVKALSAVRAVPRESFPGDYELRRKVILEGEPFVIVGRAIVS